LLQYDNKKFQIPAEKSAIATGRLIPRGKTPEDRRYTAIVMPLSLATNRFGFMWAEIGPTDWDVYLRLKNLLSSGVNRFDPVILKVFLSRMSVYPIGSMVRLNDQSIGIVIGSIPQKPLRPIVKLVFDASGERIKEHRMVNLLEEISLYVVKALDEDEAGVSFLEVL
jgi:hypothetical protein